MNLQECIERNHIFIDWDGDSREIVYIRRYNEQGERIADAFINDDSYGTPGKAWLYEALRDCENWHAYPDTVAGFAAYCAECGCPIVESDFWKPQKSEQRYEATLAQNANWWEHVRELRGNLLTLFDVNLYHELLEAAQKE